jgi:triacylglycerol lipase
MKKLMAIVLCLFAGFAQASGYSQTKYPVVLAPGVLGFDTVLGVPYWYQIPSALQSGGTTVYIATASAVNSANAVGEQLLGQVKTILAISGASKVNLIGHSEGGFSSRYVAGVLPGSVASVTTFDSPVKGSPVADDLYAFVHGTNTTGVVSTIVNAFANLFDAVAGVSYRNSIMAMLGSMSTSGAAQFNAQFPNGVPTSACGNGAASGPNGQLYFSYNGTSDVTNILDPLSLLWAGTSLAFNGAPNDGLTGQCSSHFGTVVRDNYPWNHGNAINQFLGLIGLFAPSPVPVYTAQVNRLKNAGL